MASRFFSDKLAKQTSAVIDGVEFRHLTKVLRFAIGSEVELFDGAGTVCRAVIDKIDKSSAHLKISSRSCFPAAKNGRIIIASSIAKGERFEFLIAKCTELGADRLLPAIFERTVKQPQGERASNRWHTISIESAKQCGRNFLPIIDQPLDTSSAVKILKRDYPSGRFFFGSLCKDAAAAADIEFSQSGDFVFLIGPEGGLTECEEMLLKSEGFLPVKITDTVLRIETAAIAACSLLSAKRLACSQK